ncbi:unnamed protein product [Moneuplotes crassus]|uniref:Uncharacterized protein n=1 Tax=Euplotes crassus TaxID=5936 RepID=A0AAD1UAN9_EUPCR|nr:unnamed protein product [Moneuplotes crassus]
MEAFWIWTKAKVNSIDMFSKPVSLTYQGREKFTTFLGGILSVLLTIGFVSYGMQLSIQMLTRSATSKAKNSIERDQILVSDYYNFSHEDLAFAVFIATDDSFVPFVDPSYFNVTVAQLSYSYDFKSGALNADLKEESMAICRENFPLLDHKLDDFRNFFSQISYCSTQTDFSFGGSVFFNTLKTVQIKVRRCVNETSVICKSKEEIEAKARDLTVTFIVSSKYFDFDDFETPIKRVVDDQFIFKMSSGLKKFSELYVKRSTVALSDSLLPLGEDKEDSFLTIDNYQKDQETRDMSDPIFIDLEIRQDLVVDSYERRVYSIPDFSENLENSLNFFQ